jgi:hypothetical protein
MMMKRLLGSLTIVAALAAIGITAEQVWEVHDMNRPRPKVVAPGDWSTADKAGTAPSDAIVLFDGKNFDEWIGTNGQPPQWKLADGAMEIVDKTGSIRTKKPLGSMQLHLEWASPSEVKGNSQNRGNSGVMIMGRYEVQVLDSFDNDTYPDGQAAAIYGSSPPAVNACRKPGQWQSYDIIFHRPTFKDGKIDTPATITVLHNGVLVQDHFVIGGTSFNKRRAEYQPHEDKLPLELQNHSCPVRYRNVWVRELSD